MCFLSTSVTSDSSLGCKIQAFFSMILCYKIALYLLACIMDLNLGDSSDGEAMTVASYEIDVETIKIWKNKEKRAEKQGDTRNCVR